MDDAPAAVSIRAPAWGATSLIPYCGRSPERFNPRPRVGGDRPGCAMESFQSAPPRGGRREATRSSFNHAWGATRQQVSIRAPAWGATIRPPRGGRPGRGAEPLMPGGFQSAPPRGGRRSFNPLVPLQTCFNPRPRVGGDRGALFQSAPPRGGRPDPRQRIRAPAWGATRSIRAPAWGATAAQPGFNPRPRVGGDPPLTSAPAWGATGHVASAGKRERFNPRPRVGGDRRRNPRPRVGGDGFQSAPPRGGRPWRSRFSIRAPAWGATPAS